MVEITDEAKAHLVAGRKIQAIKVVRESNKIGLKQAKEAVEAHIGETPGQYPEPEMMPISPRIILTIFVILAGVVAFLFVNSP